MKHSVAVPETRTQTVPAQTRVSRWWMARKGRQVLSDEPDPSCGLLCPLSDRQSLHCLATENACPEDQMAPWSHLARLFWGL